ncbi:hypothetical protein [Roseobacter sp. EG26]
MSTQWTREGETTDLCCRDSDPRDRHILKRPSAVDPARDPVVQA